MVNNISINISYLVRKNNLSQDEFGALFGLGKNVINKYISEKATPKLETIEKICTYFNISIDDFVKQDLSTYNNVLNEPADSYINEKKQLEENNKLLKENYKLLKTQNEYQGEIILLLREKLIDCEHEKKLLATVKKMD